MNENPRRRRRERPVLSTPIRTVAVVGASLAGLSAVEALRDLGYDGRIVVVGGEEALPYDRPPLSKQVLAGTEDVHKAVTKNDDKKPNQLNKKEALKLSDQEKLIVAEANKCIDILEAEGSAVAFPEVFQQVRQDMIHVQKRLELSDVADVTPSLTDVVSGGGAMGVPSTATALRASPQTASP